MSSSIVRNLRERSPLALISRLATSSFTRCILKTVDCRANTSRRQRAGWRTVEQQQKHSNVHHVLMRPADLCEQRASAERSAEPECKERHCVNVCRSVICNAFERAHTTGALTCRAERRRPPQAPGAAGAAHLHQTL